MESHQAGKLDISGTAKAVISCFEKLGVSYDLDRVHFPPSYLKNELEGVLDANSMWWLRYYNTVK